jgi:hypothetical protein
MVALARRDRLRSEVRRLVFDASARHRSYATGARGVAGFQNNANALSRLRSLGEVLLDDLERVFRRHVILPPWAVEALALWVLRTYAF